MVNEEPDTDVGIPERIIEDGYNSSNNSRGVSRQQQVFDIIHTPRCRFYGCKNCKAVFPDRDMAIKMGFRPCGECKP
jgi:hypothetical protein